MVNPHSRIGRMALNGLAVAMLSCFAVATTRAQSAPVSESVPTWATPVDDATGQPVQAQNATPAQPHEVAAAVSDAPGPKVHSGAIVSAVAPNAPEAPTVYTAPSRRAVSTGTTNVSVGEPAKPTQVVLAAAAPEASYKPHLVSVKNLGYSIPVGTMLSTGLENYVAQFGWSLRWNLSNDYMVDAPLPVPAGPVMQGVEYVIRAYQAQGGLMGVEPVFAQPNKVVVIQPTSVEEN